MAFVVDLDKASEAGGLKPKGDYEVIILSVDEQTTPGGKQNLKFQFVIRNDIEGQKYGNARLFYPIWKRIEPTDADLQVNGYSYAQIMALGKAAKLQNGKSYENLTEYCKDLMRKCIRVTVDHETYKGITKEIIKSVTQTKYPKCTHIWTSKNVPAPKNTNTAQSPQFYDSQAFSGFEELGEDAPF